MATVYEYNNLFLLVLKWRKPLRNHIKCAAKKLGGQNLWRIRAKKDWLAVCHVPARKGTNVGASPLMTNKQIHTHAQSRARKPATFPASFPRGWPEGKGYSLAVDDGTPIEWKGEELNLPVPVCQFASWVAVCVGTLSRCLSFILESVLFSITCVLVHNTAWDLNQMRTWAWLAKHCVVYQCQSSDQWGELESTKHNVGPR